MIYQNEVLKVFVNQEEGLPDEGLPEEETTEKPEEDEGLTEEEEI